MASKRTSNTKKHSRNQRNASSSGLRNYGLMLGAVLVAVVVVAGLVILGRTNLPPPPTPLASPSLDKSEGDVDAPVVVMEYADFQCPYCGRFAAGPEQQLKQEYVEQGQVRFVFRHMAFLGDESRWAAQAAECANDQGHFWDYHDKLFASQTGENVGDFSFDNLKQFAAGLNLDTQQFDQCLESGKYEDKVQQEAQEAQAAGVKGTPTLFVNGQLIDKGSTYSVLQGAIEAASHSGS